MIIKEWDFCFQSAAQNICTISCNFEFYAVQFLPKSWFWEIIIKEDWQSMRFILKNHIAQAAERARCRYLHPTNGQKQLTPVVELRKAERSWGEGWSYRRISINLDPWNLSNTGPPNRHHTLNEIRPPTHIVEDIQICVQSENHLTYKRLEVIGSLEVRWGKRWGHQCLDWVGWGGDVGCGAVV